MEALAELMDIIRRLIVFGFVFWLVIRLEVVYTDILDIKKKLLEEQKEK